MGCRVMLWTLAVSMAWAQEAITTFRHPAGIAISYPREWQLERKEPSIVLSPKDRTENELILIGSEESAGVTSVRDPRVEAFFVQSVSKEFPFLHRSGAGRTAQTRLGPGIIFNFSGKGPGGSAVEADVYVTLHEGMGIYLAHAAPKALIQQRRASVQRVFESLSRSGKELDRQLTGKWQRAEYRRTDPSGLAGRSSSLSRTAYTYFIFSEDGAFVFVQTSTMAGNTADLEVIVSSRSADAARGTWWTDRGKVYLSFENGRSEIYSYQVERGVPVVLEMTPPSGSPALYQLLRQ